MYSLYRAYNTITLFIPPCHMNTPLQRAITALKRSGAIGIPSPDKIAAAKDDAQWSGKKSSGDHWSLTKNHEDSYNCEC